MGGCVTKAKESISKDAPPNEFVHAGLEEEKDSLLKTNGETNVDKLETVSTQSTLSRIMHVMGPGLIVCLADTDAGCMVTAAQIGAEFGYSFVNVQLVLIPVLFMVQDLTVRLGIFTGKGHGELIKEQFGTGWACFSIGTLLITCWGCMVTEMAGIAAAGSLCGVPPWASMLLADAALMATVLLNGYTIAERVALSAGLFELFFFVLMIQGLMTDSKDEVNLWEFPFESSRYWYMLAANIGAVIMPFMIFYQQSSVVDKRLTKDDLFLARCDTLFGCILTQLIMIAMMVAAAHSLRSQGGLDSVSSISTAFTTQLGDVAGKLIFGLGIAGASIIAAIVLACTSAWGIGEVAGYPRSLNLGITEAPAFYIVFTLSLLVGNAAALSVDDKAMVNLNVAMEVLNGLLLLPTLGFLFILARTSLPKEEQLQGLLAVFYGVVFSACIGICWCATAWDVLKAV